MPLDQATIITKAREVTGNKETRAVAERFATDTGIGIGLGKYVRELNKLVGNATGVKEVTFQTVDGQQDYSIEDEIGADVGQIQEVVRSGSYLAANLLDDTEV